MAPTVVVDDLTVVRGRATALGGVSLAIEPGRVTGLLGPSGSGKTTLLRSVVGVQRLSSGSVTVLGLPAGTAALRRRVAYMTQAPSVYGDITVGENLHFFARVVGVGAAAVDEAVATVDLGGHRAQRVSDLSGGERARVSLAVALLGRPEVLVLDEPTVGLDPLLRRDLWRAFAAIAGEGRTIVVSSHVMDEAARCDDLILLRDGAVLATSTPDALLRDTGAADLDAAFLALVERGHER